MKLYSENKDYKLYNGSMLDMLEVIESNTIDSIVTDPPYELNFMGKGWDNSGIAFQPDTWKKCFDVLKPGGYLLAFGGSRTFHRIACAIEDAGFEIRDTIMWLYGSGFPNTKSEIAVRHNSGSASRYFYCAKASKKDRDEGLDEFEEKLPACMTDFRPTLATNPENWNNGEPVDYAMMRTKPRKNTHPTVKPTELMQYLVRLVTPNNGTILDPFNGSGSTGKAVMYENKERNKDYKYIGIELTEEYLPIAKARIEYVCNLIEEDKKKDKQLSIFDLGESNE